MNRTYPDGFSYDRDGKISSEMLRRKSYAEELVQLELGFAQLKEDSRVEYAIFDKAGRLQVPAAYLEPIGVKNSNKVKHGLAEVSLNRSARTIAGNQRNPHPLRIGISLSEGILVCEGINIKHESAMP